MSENLIRRIFTSFFLLSILFICLSINKYSWLFFCSVADVPTPMRSLPTVKLAKVCAFCKFYKM